MGDRRQVERLSKKGLLPFYISLSCIICIPSSLPIFFFAAPLDESMYSVVSQPKGNAEPAHRAQPKEQYYRASFDYEAQGAEELSFKAGDLIKLCYKEDSTWWCGEVHGKKGMFPKDFVE